MELLYDRNVGLSLISFPLKSMCVQFFLMLSQSKVMNSDIRYISEMLILER